MATQKERSYKAYRNRKDNGLCPRCGEPLDREGYYCSACLEKVREYNRKNREFYRKNHLCTACGRVAVPEGERICPECRVKQNNRRKPLAEEQKIRYRNKFREQQNALYRQHSEQGICTRCGKRKSVPGKKRCAICLQKDAENHRKRYMDRPDIKEYRKENHLCYFCGEPIDLPTGSSCSKCREKFMELAKGRKSDNKYWRYDNRMVFGGRR